MKTITLNITKDQLNNIIEGLKLQRDYQRLSYAQVEFLPDSKQNDAWDEDAKAEREVKQLIAQLRKAFKKGKVLKESK